MGNTIVISSVFVSLCILIVGHYIVRALDHILVKLSQSNAVLASYTHMEHIRRDKQVEFLTRKLSLMDTNPKMLPKTIPSVPEMTFPMQKTQVKKSFILKETDVILLKNNSFAGVDYLCHDSVFGIGLGSYKGTQYRWNLKGECSLLLRNGTSYTSSVMDLSEHNIDRKAE